MNRQLFKMLLPMRCSINVFRTYPKLLQQVKCFSTGRQVFRGYNRVNCTHRAYVTIPEPVKRLFANSAPWYQHAIFLSSLGGLYAFNAYLKQRKKKKEIAEETKSIGEPSIGGPFDLVDINGNDVTDETFLGKWILIYFGFCHCPDVCPDLLEKLSSVVEKVNALPHVPDLQPIFISVDPERDTPELIKEYLKDFHPNFIGLTGSEEQVKRCCKVYRIYFSKGPEDEDNDYIVDHTVYSLLVDPNGKFSEYYGQTKTIDEIVDSIATKMSEMSEK